MDRMKKRTKDRVKDKMKKKLRTECRTKWRTDSRARRESVQIHADRQGINFIFWFFHWFFDSFLPFIHPSFHPSSLPTFLSVVFHSFFPPSVFTSYPITSFYCLKNKQNVVVYSRGEQQPNTRASACAEPLHFLDRHLPLSYSVCFHTIYVPP